MLKVVTQFYFIFCTKLSHYKIIKHFICGCEVIYEDYILTVISYVKIVTKSLRIYSSTCVYIQSYVELTFVVVEAKLANETVCSFGSMLKKDGLIRTQQLLANSSIYGCKCKHHCLLLLCYLHYNDGH